jgi:hypothetical protein
MTTETQLTAAPEQQTAPRAPMVYAAVSRVMAEIGASGIAKDRKNHEQKFNFRGIDDALQAFNPLLAKHGLILAPHYADKVIEARPTKSGGTTYNASLSGTFTFTSIHDGSSWTVGPFYGEANDGQDKAISKATSVAERNMFYLTFVVPHEAAIGGDPDEGQEDDAPAYDLAPWFQQIDEAGDMDALTAIADEIKASNIPAMALRNIRARWAQRQNAIKGAQA